MVRSSTPLKKDISAFAVFIVQMLFERGVGEIDVLRSLFSECSVTGTIVSFCCGIRKAPPLFDTCILLGGAACLYALFEWGLTVREFYIALIVKSKTH
jgi:hypothetical protein